MLFSEVIREAGLNPNSFPKVSNFTVKVFDGKGRENISNSLKYATKLFENNQVALKNFDDLMSFLEKNYQRLNYAEVEIGINYVKVNASLTDATINILFLRFRIDAMDRE